ncbi:hypothetical protein OG453_07070 [Streptomyces sp. NBC_01381]|uniref:hypothetical protein n=1 Tax=Streptomyces sp. NBC_01381 TaxID=2903845 RepID=UPI00224D6EAB|nr:hypothetical protein [Streptomyces sp. NBC_01381]MCX4666429.1 hypothetical protein [Streptomyces sp. NBC_01381]
MAKPLIVGRHEFAKLYRVGVTTVSNGWVFRGDLSYDDAAIVSGKPFWPGGLAVAFAHPDGGKERQLDKTVLRELEKEQRATFRPASKGELPALVGLQEYGALFGVTQQQVSSARRRGGGMVAADDYVLSSSPVWLLDSVLEAAEETLARSRGGTWRLHEDVVEALREGRYEGPGSSIAKRGNYGTADG